MSLNSRLGKSEKGRSELLRAGWGRRGSGSGKLQRCHLSNAYNHTEKGIFVDVSCGFFLGGRGGNIGIGYEVRAVKRVRSTKALATNLPSSMMWLTSPAPRSLSR